MFLMSLKSPLSMYTHWKFQVSTSRLYKLHTGTKPVEMSQNPSHMHTSVTQLKVSCVKLPSSADDFENSLLVSNPAHISFCTVKLKHPTEGRRRKTYF